MRGVNCTLNDEQIILGKGCVRSSVLSARRNEVLVRAISCATIEGKLCTATKRHDRVLIHYILISSLKIFLSKASLCLDSLAEEEVKTESDVIEGMEIATRSKGLKSTPFCDFVTYDFNGTTADLNFL